MSGGASAQRQQIAGPAGQLEALLETPAGRPPVLVAVICHPHPLFGGTLDNKVVHSVASTLRRCGAATLRFNFRGVGASAGVHDGGAGETDDALTAVTAARKRWPTLPLVLGGFSFGAAVAIRAAARARPDWLISVAPAVDRVPLDDFTAPECPWLIVQGDADEVVSAELVRQWRAARAGSARLCSLPGVGHFFHGRLHELQDCLLAQWPAGLPATVPEA